MPIRAVACLSLYSSSNEERQDSCCRNSLGRADMFLWKNVDHKYLN
jgi:hypothetical protein